MESNQDSPLIRLPQPIGSRDKSKGPCKGKPFNVMLRTIDLTPLKGGRRARSNMCESLDKAQAGSLGHENLGLLMLRDKLQVTRGAHGSYLGHLLVSLFCLKVER